MATGDSGEDLSASVIGGSEDAFEFFCQPCSQDNHHVEAEWFCQDCCEYLCTNCYKVHRKLSATKNHAIQNKEEMPKLKGPVKPKNVLTKKCTKHTDKVIEYWCNGHGQLCCNVCLSLNHRACSDIVYIPEESDEITNSPEYKQLLNDLNRLIAMVTVGQRKMHYNGTQINDMHSAALSDIKEFRKEMNELLDKLEHDIETQLSTISDKEAAKVDSAAAKCDSFLLETREMLDGMTEMEKDERNNELFIEMKTARKRIVVIEEEVTDVIDNKRVTLYKFQRNYQLEKLLSTPPSIGTLSSTKETSDVTAQYIKDINVKSPEDTEECFITGIAVLPDGRVIVSDHKNKSIKLINVDENIILSRVSLSAPPFDVTVVGEDKVAVAIPREKKIAMYSVSNLLSNSLAKTVLAIYKGVIYNTDSFICVSEQKARVEFIDMNGKVILTFDGGSDDQLSFKMPRCVALSPDRSMMYVTDRENDTVTCMTVTGEVISVYKDNQLKYPYGVTVDEDGNVYVCSRDTVTIHQLTPSCTKGHVLLERKDGLVDLPGVVAYSVSDHKLYISSRSSKAKLKNNLKLFQIK